MNHSLKILVACGLIFLNSCAAAQTKVVGAKSNDQPDPEVVLTTGHNDQVNDIEVSANGKYFASGANNKVIKIWDVATSREFRLISDCDGRIVRVKWSPDNIHLAALLYSDEIKVWNVVTGETINSFPASATSRSIDFVDAGKSIVYLNEDSKLAYATVKTGETKVFEEVYGMTVNSDSKKMESYLLDHKGKLITANYLTGEVKNNWQVFPEMNFPFSNMEYDPKSGLLAGGFNDDIVYVFNPASNKIVYKSKKMASKIQDVDFRPGTNYIYASDHLGNLKGFDMSSKKMVLESGEEYKRVQKFAFHPDGNYYIQASHEVIDFVNPDNGQILQSIKGEIGKMERMSLSASGKYLAAAKTKVTIDVWDLNQNRVVRNLQGFFPCQFSAEGERLYSMHYMLNLVEWDVQSGKKIKEFDTEKELIQVLAVSQDGKYLAGAGFLGLVKIWDTESGKMIHKLSGHAGGIYGLAFSPDNKYLASSGMDKTVRIWNVENGSQEQQISDQQIIISDVQFSPDGKVLASASWDKTIKLYNTADWSLKKSLEGHVSIVHDLDFSADGKYLASSGGNNVVSKNDNSVIIWDVETGEQFDRYIAHTDQVFRVEFDAESHRVYAGSNDGTFSVYDVDRKSLLARMMSTNNSEFLILTPDNYYMGSKAALKSVSFRIGEELYPLEQFDLRLNRPDIVAERLGKTAPNLIKAYKYIYQKRLKKMGIKEEDLDGGYSLPKIQFKDKIKIPVVSSDEFLSLKFDASDENNTIDRVNVYVNGVPIYGVKGISFKSENKKEVSSTIKVPLIDGKNDIAITCLSATGVESLTDRVRVLRESGTANSNLYVVTIGVSKYADERFNLTYPSKDASDIRESLKSKSDIYANIYVKDLINEQATKENILALGEFLKNAKPNDAVVIFVAGHGVLDENFDYFFGTHNMDFNNPSENGLPYEALENILSEVKALKKLLIMDTCHSGEVDKDEIENGSDPVQESEGDVEFRSAGAGVREKKGLGVNNSAELMQDLFSDLRKGSGATVISSAGGAEYAMESAEWKNGLFTYCLLKGLKNLEADYNMDKQVQISEIRKYVYESVSNLSNGKQRPTARRENIYLDYRLY